MAGGRSWRPAYRVRQFLQAVLAGLAPLSPADLAEARAHLPASAWPLFAAMGRGDQRHSLQVLRTLQTGGAANPALAQAALLHDCAKSPAGTRLWHRVAAVLLLALAPAWAARWRSEQPPEGSWRYAFWAHLNHAQRGAELAAAAGCDSLAVLLIAHHQDRAPAALGRPEAQRWLAALQAADDAN